MSFSRKAYSPIGSSGLFDILLVLMPTECWKRLGRTESALAKLDGAQRNEDSGRLAIVTVAIDEVVGFRLGKFFAKSAAVSLAKVAVAVDVSGEGTNFEGFENRLLL